MKKFLLLPVCFLCISSVLFAQKRLGAGLKAGVNVATQVTSGKAENVDSQSLVGFHGGVTVNYFIIDRLAIQVDGLISQKGSKWSDPYFSGKDKLSYLDIPMLVRFQLLNFLNIHAGPQFSYLLSAVQDDISSGEKFDIIDWYNKAEIGIAVGAEANLPLNINLSIRYILGISEASNDVEYIDPWKNSYVQVSIGYRFMGM